MSVESMPNIEVIDFDCLVLEDLVWTEIDDEVHLKRAKDEIYPMIKLREQKY